MNHAGLGPVHSVIAGEQFNGSGFAILLDLQTQRSDGNGLWKFEDDIRAFLGIFGLGKRDKGFIISIDRRRPIDAWNVRTDFRMEGRHRHRITR